MLAMEAARLDDNRRSHLGNPPAPAGEDERGEDEEKTEGRAELLTGEVGRGPLPQADEPSERAVEKL